MMNDLERRMLDALAEIIATDILRRQNNDETPNKETA